MNALEMIRCTLLVVYMFDVFKFSDALVCGSITRESEDGRLIQVVQKNDSHISLNRLASVPQSDLRHQPCMGAAGIDESLIETARLLRVRVSRRVQPTRLESVSSVENAALTSLLTRIVTRELSHCVLVLLWDELYARTSLVDRLVHLPNPKQVRPAL